MIAKRSLTPPVRTRATPLWLKLLGLFAAAFVIAFAAFFAYGLVTSYAERSILNAQGNDPAAPIVVDPKIESDLAKVLAFDNSAQPPQTVKDPFADRGGLSGEVSASTGGVTRSTVTPSTAPDKAATTGGSRTSGAKPPAIPAVESTKHRYETWLAQYGESGDVPLDPRIFAIEDLLPVGIVDGGSGQQEVMFYSEAAEKTFSFPVGTMFFDGWVTEIQPEGVVFNFNDERRTIRMRTWARTLQNARQTR